MRLPSGARGFESLRLRTRKQGTERYSVFVYIKGFEPLRRRSRKGRSGGSFLSSAAWKAAKPPVGIPPSARSSHSAKQNLRWLRRLVIRRDPRSGRIPYDLPLTKKGMPKSIPFFVHIIKARFLAMILISSWTWSVRIFLWYVINGRSSIVLMISVFIVSEVLSEKIYELTE